MREEGLEVLLKPLDQKTFFDAALNGDTDQVRDALARGTDVNQTDADKRTALMLACFNGHARIIRLLLEAKAALAKMISEAR